MLNNHRDKKQGSPEQSDAMKKVLILTNVSRGLHNFRFELVNELVREGYRVYFTVLDPKEDQKVKLLVQTGAMHIQTPFDRRGTNPIKDLRLIRQYHKIVKDIGPDIILTYTIKPNIYGSYVASKFNKPIIMNVTGIGSALASENKHKIMIKQMYKYACNKATVVFFQNQANLDFFVSNNLVDKAKVRLIPGSGVNTDKFRPENKTSEDGIIRFLFIGRIMQEKGIEEYLVAAESVTKKYANTEFQILGPFEEEKYRDVLLEITNERVKYLGVSSDVINELKQVDCVVNPSYHEGMSNVLLEGAAMGKPLIASDIPGCKEIIEHGYNGYLFKVRSAQSLADKIMQFIQLGDEEKKSMGENSRKKIEAEFDRNMIVNEYMRAINDIFGQG